MYHLGAFTPPAWRWGVNAAGTPGAPLEGLPDDQLLERICGPAPVEAALADEGEAHVLPGLEDDVALEAAGGAAAGDDGVEGGRAELTLDLRGAALRAVERRRDAELGIVGTEGGGLDGRHAGVFSVSRARRRVGW